MNIKRLSIIPLFLTLFAAVFSSCGGASDNMLSVTADTVTATESAETEPAYVYPDVNYNGAEFRILNFDQLWDMFIHIDFEQLDGEILHDAVYNRNRKVESQLGCKIVEKELVNTSNTTSEPTKAAKASILAGEDAYDIMYLDFKSDTSIMTEGYLLNLLDMPEFNFSEEWWDTAITDSLTYNNNLIGASGALNLMPFDATAVLFFNQDMCNEFGYDLPYDKVRDGTWTFDALAEYTKSVANLNGDADWGWNQNNKCLYGMAIHQSAFCQRFIYSGGADFVKVGSSGKFELTIDTERFYSLMEKLASLCKAGEGYAFKASWDDFNADIGGYCYTFYNKRSLFLTAEIKTAQLFRDMEDTFGIVPNPKYDEAQEEYRVCVCPFLMTVPATNTNLSRTATIAEVLTHDSHCDVIPVYYDYIVNQKGLRNEDSIEMMDIARRGRGIELGEVYGLANELRNKMNDHILAGDPAVASVVESYRANVEANIEKFIAALEN
ncbi:MAG: hypothetical protein GX628_02095 [Clostridiales bacterium]|nr:hypothetical protein [Clostridiales bacterium]